MVTSKASWRWGCCCWDGLSLSLDLSWAHFGVSPSRKQDWNACLSKWQRTKINMDPGNGSWIGYLSNTNKSCTEHFPSQSGPGTGCSRVWKVSACLGSRADSRRSTPDSLRAGLCALYSPSTPCSSLRFGGCRAVGKMKLTLNCFYLWLVLLTMHGLQ